MAATDNITGDMRLGLRQSLDDTAIAALVVLPFAGTAGVFLNALIAPPAAVTLVLTALLAAAATLWNAGWRARTAS